MSVIDSKKDNTDSTESVKNVNNRDDIPFEFLMEIYNSIGNEKALSQLITPKPKSTKEQPSTTKQLEDLSNSILEDIFQTKKTLKLANKRDSFEIQSIMHFSFTNEKELDSESKMILKQLLEKINGLATKVERLEKVVIQTSAKNKSESFEKIEAIKNEISLDLLSSAKLNTENPNIKVKDNNIVKENLLNIQKTDKGKRRTFNHISKKKNNEITQFFGLAKGLKEQ